MSELTEKARALADAATEGPWFPHGGPDALPHEGSFPRVDASPGFPWATVAWVPEGAVGPGNAEAVTAFIAEARTLVPALCDENAAQAARIRELAAELRRAKGFGQEKIG